MTLRAKILIALVVILTMVGTLLSFNTIMAKRESMQMRRLIIVHQKYSALLNLKIHVDRQLAEAQAIFIYGKELDGDFEASTNAIRAAMEALVRAVKSEGNLMAISGIDSAQNGQEPSARLIELQHKYEDINRQIVLMGRLVGVGRNAKAVDHFKREVHDRFNDFFAAIDAWTLSESNKQQDIEELYVKLTRRQNLMSIIGLSAILVIVLVYSFTVIYLLGPRLKNLLQGTRQIARGDFSQPVLEKGTDEFSVLAKSMNQMMKDLAASRKKLLEQSYYSGMADMVSGTLHNLRNSLSPVVVELEAIEAELNAVRTDRFKMVADELSGSDTDPGRVPQLLEYSQLSLLEIVERVPKISGDVAAVRRKIDLIEKVLNEQSRFSLMERPLETVPLTELIQDSKALVKQGYLDVIDFVVKNSDAVAPIKTQRIVLIQVLANLINNAVESVLRSDLAPAERVVSVSCAEETEHGKPTIHIQVSDNGVGIEPSMLKTIFLRGVSDKEKGYGLGLHWCANSIASLNGSLYAESGGVGCGAVMHLILGR